MTSLALLAAIAFPRADYRARYPLPSLAVPSGWGVNIHFTQERPGEVAKIARAGFRFVRMDFFWHETEKAKGKYDFSAYDRLMVALEKQKIRPLFILDYGNDLYQKGSPRSPESRAAFARWVAAAVSRYRGRGVIWEMWNEPNIFFWQPKPNVDEYVALAREVGRTIRRVAPEEWYVGPATSSFDWEFLRRCFEAGLLGYWDAVTVHPYRQTEPETVLADWARLRAMIDDGTPKGRRVPMFASEWGYSELYSGMSIGKQGLYVPRQYLTNLVAGAPLTIYYDWRDDGPDPKEVEHHFGTVFQDLSPKPAYLAVRAIASALNGYTYRMRLALGSPEKFLLVLRKGDSLRFVGWTTGAAPSPLPRSLAGREVSLTSAARVLPLKPPADVRRVLVAWRPAPPSASIATAAQGAALARSLRDGLLALPAVPRVRLALGSTFTGTKAELRRAADLPARVGRDAEWSLDAAPRTWRTEVSTPSGVTLAQETLVLQPRPIEMSLAASSDGLQAVLDNPGGRAMRGLVAVGDRTAPFVLRAQDRQIAVPLPAAARSGPISVRLLRAGGGPPALRLEGVRVRRFDRFGNGALDPGRYALVDEGDPKLKSTLRAEVVPTASGEGVRVRYTFPVGWKYLALQTRGETAAPVPGVPVSLGVWAKGDASGDMLRMRFVDASGQTFQPDAGPIDWKGWRFVSFPLDGRAAGRWGGANDGVVRYPVRIETLALVDSWGGRGGSGDVTFAGFTLLTK